jgi:hypothetical protein
LSYIYIFDPRNEIINIYRQTIRKAKLYKILSLYLLYRIYEVYVVCNSRPGSDF